MYLKILKSAYPYVDIHSLSFICRGRRIVVGQLIDEFLLHLGPA